MTLPPIPTPAASMQGRYIYAEHTNACMHALSTDCLKHKYRCELEMVHAGSFR